MKIISKRSEELNLSDSKKILYVGEVTEVDMLTLTTPISLP
ncbi:hypothetical protein [Campylobacter concisus]